MKKIIAFALVALVAVGLTACKRNDTDTTSGTNAQTPAATSQPATTPAAPAPTTNNSAKTGTAS